jgi:adenylate cyclase
MKLFLWFKSWLGSAKGVVVILSFATLVSGVFVAKLVATNRVTDLSDTVYDAMIRNRIWAPPMDRRIVIVDIDEASLLAMSSEFGRWPWPRDTLASVLTFVSNQNPAAIVWDILFSDLDRASPGGDKAFNEATRKSKNNIHSVVRLPFLYDSKSNVDFTSLPNLWMEGTPKGVSPSKVALIPPILPALGAGPLGFNNAHPDADGILRKYRWTETLKDASSIQSIAVATARVIDPGAIFPKQETLINWRKKANSYPRVSFWEVFADADSQRKMGNVSFEKKIVIFGATASSLHDRLPTSLESKQAGVDVLATVLDNALNRQFLFELPPALVAMLGLLVVWAIAYVAWYRGVEALHGGLVVVPTVLLLVSFLSLHGSSWFVDLSGAAGAGLALVGALKIWNGWRRDYWCGFLDSTAGLLIVVSRNTLTFDDRTTDLILRIFESNAPNCRLVGGDTSSPWPAKLRWPEVLNHCSIVGPIAELEEFRQLGMRGVKPFNEFCFFSTVRSFPSKLTRLEIVKAIQSELSITYEFLDAVNQTN